MQIESLISIPLESLLVIGFALLVGGLTKGTLGIGMPAFAVPIMLVVVPLPVAIALLVAPSYVSNLIEIGHMNNRIRAVKRFAYLITGLSVGSFIGAFTLVHLQVDWAILALGLFAIGFAAVQAFKVQPNIPSALEQPMGAAVGFASGVFGSFTGLFGPPIAAFLLSLKMKHEDFVGAVSLIYLFGLSVLHLFLVRSGVLDRQILLVSCVGCIFVYGGMFIGRQFRRAAGEPTLKFVTVAFMAFVGVDLCLRYLDIRWFDPSTWP